MWPGRSFTKASHVIISCLWKIPLQKAFGSSKHQVKAPGLCRSRHSQLASLRRSRADEISSLDGGSIPSDALPLSLLTRAPVSALMLRGTEQSPPVPPNIRHPLPFLNVRMAFCFAHVESQTLGQTYCCFWSRSSTDTCPLGKVDKNCG